MAVLNVPADFPTIQAAVIAASPGDTILIAPGVYTESVTIPDGKDRLRIEGAGPTQTILHGTNTLPFGIHSTGSPLVTVRSLGVRNFTGPGILSTAPQNRWSDLLLESNGTQGIEVLGATQNVIEFVTARCNGGDGISLFQESLVLYSHALYNRRNGIVATEGSSLLFRNRTEWNGNRGIVLGARESQVIENHVRHNGVRGPGGGIRVHGGAHLLLGNTVTQNAGAGIDLFDTDQVRVHQNLVTGNLRGISLLGEAVLNSLTRNEVRRNAAEGVRVLSPASQNLTGENQVIANGSAGIRHRVQTTLNVIRRNTALQNHPDLLDENGAGTTNIYAANLCQTAVPAFLCNPALNVLLVPSQFPTIQAAVDASTPGQVILVAPGTYNEEVTVGGDHDRILIQGAGQGASILDGQGSLGTAFSIVGSQMVTIRGFTIQNYTAHGLFSQTDNHWLDDLELTGISDAAVRIVAFQNLVTDLNLHDSPSRGIVIESTSNNWLVRNRLQNAQEGIVLFQGASRNLLLGNNAQANTDGFVLFAELNRLVENVAGSTRRGIVLDAAPTTLLLGNRVVGSRLRGIDLTASPSSLVLRNEAAENDVGIRLLLSDNSLIVGNSALQNEDDGLAIQSSVNLVGDENEARNNGEVGLRVTAGPGNAFRRNVLCENGPPDLDDFLGNNTYDLNTCDTSDPPGLCDFPCA